MKEISKKNLLIFIILGKAGSGKGTQGKLIAKKFNLKYLGAGYTLRMRQKVKDFTGKKLTKVMNRGELAPSFTIVKILGDELEGLRKQAKINGFVLDGWTRTVFEAVLTDEAIGWYEWSKDARVILIKISNKASFNRLTKRRQCRKCGRIIPWIGGFKKIKKCDKCGGELITRLDDNIKSIKKRLDEYKKETIPAINYYKKKKRLIEINGEQSIENVFKDILKALK